VIMRPAQTPIPLPGPGPPEQETHNSRPGILELHPPRDPARRHDTPESWEIVIARMLRCQQADRNCVSWVTDSRVVVRHANGGWSFRAGDKNGAGRSARPSRPGGGAVHAEGGQDVLKRPRYYRMQARARTDGFGQYLYVCTRMNRNQIVP